MIIVCRNANRRFDKPLLSGFSKIKFYNLILRNNHCNGYGQIFFENLVQNQRFCVETNMFRLAITIISFTVGRILSYYGNIKNIYLIKKQQNCRNTQSNCNTTCYSKNLNFAVFLFLFFSIS